MRIWSRGMKLFCPSLPLLQQSPRPTSASLARRLADLIRLYQRRPQYDPKHPCTDPEQDPLAPWTVTHLVSDPGDYPDFYKSLTKAQQRKLGAVICVIGRRVPTKDSEANAGKVDRKVITMERGFHAMTDAASARRVLNWIEKGDRVQSEWYAQRADRRSRESRPRSTLAEQVRLMRDRLDEVHDVTVLQRSGDRPGTSQQQQQQRQPEAGPDPKRRNTRSSSPQAAECGPETELRTTDLAGADGEDNNDENMVSNSSLEALFRSAPFADFSSAHRSKAAREEVLDNLSSLDQTEPAETPVSNRLTLSQVQAVQKLLEITADVELEFHWTSAHSLPNSLLDKLTNGLSVLVKSRWLIEPEPLVYSFVKPKPGVEVTSDFHTAWQTVALFMRLCLASQFLHATATGVYRHYTWCEVKNPNAIRHRVYAPPLAFCELPVQQANSARQQQKFVSPFLSAKDYSHLDKFGLVNHGDRVSGFHHAPRIDNSGPNPALLINGVALEWLTIDTGCESVIISNWTAKKLGITSSMRQRKAISLITADAVTTAPVDRTWDTIEIVINPNTSAETIVQVKLTIVPSQTKETLIGMSVIGRIGLTVNPYKQTLTYYTKWWAEESPTAELPAIFHVDTISNCVSAATSSRLNPVTFAYAGRVTGPRAPRPPPPFVQLCTGPVHAPKTAQEERSVRLQLEFRDQLDTQTVIACFQRTIRSLAEPPPPTALLDSKFGSPLDFNFVEIHEQTAVNNTGIVVIELCSGLCATTEALVRNGVNIRRLYACEIDALSRDVAQQRLATLVKLFPHLITSEAIESCHTTLPHDVLEITEQKLAELEPPDFIVVGFPCQGFSSAAIRPLGLRDTRTALFYTCVDLVRSVYEIHGPCVWLLKTSTQRIIATHKLRMNIIT